MRYFCGCCAVADTTYAFVLPSSKLLKLSEIWITLWSCLLRQAAYTLRYFTASTYKALLYVSCDYYKLHSHHCKANCNWNSPGLYCSAERRLICILSGGSQAHCTDTWVKTEPTPHRRRRYNIRWTRRPDQHASSLHSITTAAANPRPPDRQLFGANPIYQTTMTTSVFARHNQSNARLIRALSTSTPAP